MFRDPPSDTRSEPDLIVWLAGPQARSRFDACEQSPEDLERWKHIRTTPRRDEWAVSRALLAHARRELRQLAAPDARVEGRFGQVASAGTESAHLLTNVAPAPRAAISFGRERVPLSLSHSAGHAAVAASRRALRVGVDLEHIRPRDVMGLARFAFSEAEQAQLAALAPEARSERFYILWTLKEAFTKALSSAFLSSLSTYVFLEEGNAWHASVPGAGEWIARVFEPAPMFTLSVVALLPPGTPAEHFCIRTSNWESAEARSWRLLAALDSRSAVR